jgi:hypothetical protein
MRKSVYFVGAHFLLLFVLLFNVQRSDASRVDCEGEKETLAGTNFLGYKERLMKLRQAGVPEEFIKKTKEERKAAIAKQVAQKYPECAENKENHED